MNYPRGGCLWSVGGGRGKNTCRLDVGPLVASSPDGGVNGLFLDFLSFSFLQYKTCKDGSVLGVTVTRIALLTHCQALTQACGYTEGISML